MRPPRKAAEIIRKKSTVKPEIHPRWQAASGSGHDPPLLHENHPVTVQDKIILVQHRRKLIINHESQTAVIRSEPCNKRIFRVTAPAKKQIKVAACAAGRLHDAGAGPYSVGIAIKQGTLHCRRVSRAARKIPEPDRKSR